MNNSLPSLAAGALAAAFGGPALAGPSDSAAAVTTDLLPAVMHFKVDYSEARDAPAELDGLVRDMLHKIDPSQALPFKPGCVTISGSGAGWDDSDYRGRGCTE